ncbi:MAG: AI-2E family transporter [Deltaproteobacteria bacterium]|nr:AI-2E family transporter [Deltaproteobacteria bacterium]
MKKKYIFFLFILLLAFFTFYYLYQVFSPFLASIVWAILLAIAFYPLFLKFQRLLRKRRVLAALAITLFTFLVIVLPVSLLMVSLANEVMDFYHHLDEMIKTGQLQSSLSQIRELPLLKGVMERLNRYVDLSSVDPLNFLLKNVQQISVFLFNQTSNLLKGVSTFVAGFFFTLLSLYYLFKDGDRLLTWIKEIVPFPAKESEMIIERFKAMISATLYGGILIAILQGILGGVSFWILGISSPVFWGTTMAFLSFIPMGGTALIWGPAALFLFLQGAFLKGIILLGLGILLIGMVDNLLRPFLVSTKTKIHPLLLFFSVLGGIQAFGIIGLVGGPLIVTLFLTLVEIYIQGIKSSE